MLSPKKLMKVASIGSRRRRLRISEKGHFVVYTVDHVRFMLPLSYLELGFFRELLRMSEEEFGSSSVGPITLPCNAPSLEYMIMLLTKRGVTQDLEIKAMLLDSINSTNSTRSDFTSDKEFVVGPNMVMCHV